MYGAAVELCSLDNKRDFKTQEVGEQAATWPEDFVRIGGDKKHIEHLSHVWMA